MTAGTHDDQLARAARRAFALPVEPVDADDADGELPLRTFGDYELLDVIGAGGMGVVYRARHRLLDREVALKIIAEDARNDDSGTLFLDEARNAARLNHPGIVPVHDVGTRGGLHYFSMQLVDGEHLGRRIARGALSERDAIALLLPVCDALDYAHRLGVLHLDLKPANILLDARGAPLVADFGLARRVGADGTARARDVSGTPAYMAPEQLQAESGGLTVATDVYSLGAVLYEMLAGVSPHGRGDSAELAARALSGNIAPLSRHRPGVSRDLAAVCGHCLEHDPARRYGGVAALAEDLRRVRDGLPVDLRRPGLGERLSRWVQREPRFATAITVALFAMLAGALATGAMWRHAERARARAELSAELGARLYVRADGEYDKGSGVELVKWLKERLPDDPEAQAAVLSDYLGALVEEDVGLRINSLGDEVMAGLGTGYRKEVIALLRRRGDPESLMQAAMLAWNVESETGAPVGYADAMATAVASAPGVAFTWAIAATYCMRDEHFAPPRCAVAGAAERLVALDPDNAWSWAVLAAHRAPERAADALQEAAKRDVLHDYYDSGRAGLADAIVTSGVPLPAPIAMVGMTHSAFPDPVVLVADGEAWTFPEAVPLRIGWLCDPARNAAFVDAMRDDCLALARTMLDARGSVAVTMLAWSIAERLAPGSPLAQRANARRREFVYRRETHPRLPPSPDGVAGLAALYRDIVEFGELEAMGRMLARRGAPADPPVDWTPRDPEALKLPELRASPH